MKPASREDMDCGDDVPCGDVAAVATMVEMVITLATISGWLLLVMWRGFDDFWSIFICSILKIAPLRLHLFSVEPYWQ